MRLGEIDESELTFNMPESDPRRVRNHFQTLLPNFGGRCNRAAIGQPAIRMSGTLTGACGSGRR
jgi:hypothetical protein